MIFPDDGGDEAPDVALEGGTADSLGEAGFMEALPAGMAPVWRAGFGWVAAFH